jgi:CheY-like chemotaxis protein
MKVLIVDDDPDVREYAVSVFEMMGFEVLAAPDGRAALPFLHDHQDIDLLFTDIRMPEMDGTELAEEALKLRPDLPVIFTSGHPGGPLPNVPFIPKPFRPREVAQLVRHALNSTDAAG